MKRTIWLIWLPILLLLLSSFNARKQYRLYANTETVYPEYLSLRVNNYVQGDRYFELYTGRGNGTIIGSWSEVGDTIILTPTLEVLYRGDELIDLPIPKNLPDSLRTNLTLQKKLLIAEDGKKIVDVTDYSVLWPETDMPQKIYYYTFNLVFEN